MAGRILLFQHPWLRWLDAARVVLGLACLAAQVFPSAPAVPWVTILTAGFTLWSLLPLLWRRAFEKAPARTLCLFVDTAFFMLFAALGADFDSWLASAYYCYLLLSAVLGHDWPDVLIVSGACIAFMALLPSPEADLLRRLVLFAGLLACALAVWKGKLQRRLEQAARNGQDLPEEVQKACAAERDRIAGDFHDGPLQDVISLQVRLEVVKSLLERDPSGGLKELDALQQLSKAVVTGLRSFLRTMRPPPVEGPDLAASVRLVVDDFQKDSDIQVRFAAPTAPITAAPETALEALQILREALHNVRKHSQATRVVISLERTGQTLEMAVEDDGAGFAFGGAFTLEELERLRLGPQSIQQRVRKLGGDLRLESRPGQGAALRIWIPI